MSCDITLIAGNIGAGKTEQVRYIATQIQEPDETVEETIRGNALKLFYRSREAYGDAKKAITAMVEESFLDDRLMNHLEIKYSEGRRFIDRGILEGACTFALNSFQEGNLTYHDYQNYLNKMRGGFDKLDRATTEKWLEQLIVYLEVKDPRILLERVKKRDRTDEVITLDYLGRVNDNYGQFFDNIKPTYESYGLPVPEVLRITADADFTDDTLKVFHEMTWKQIQHKMTEMVARNL